MITAIHVNKKPSLAPYSRQSRSSTRPSRIVSSKPYDCHARSA